jgi:hypothetical protein
MTHLYVTFENGRTADLGPASRPHDGIGTVRDLLVASDDVAYVEWRDPDTGFVAFTGTRVSAKSFGWKSPAMGSYAYASLA